MKLPVKPISLICIVLGYLQIMSCASNRKIGFKQDASSLVIPDTLYPPANLIIATHNAWTRANYPKRIKNFKDQPLQLHDIVFIGNSITEQGGDWSKRLNKEAVKNRGIAGDVTDGVLARLREVTYVKPTAVFIEIGINDLFNPTLNPERIANNIIRIADTIKKQSPRTKIFVQTIFPTKNDFMVNKISETNKLIRNYKKPKLFTLIDTYALFADSADLMKKEYTKDGVHLNEKGYEVWVNYLLGYFK
ncbi:MAG: GDSL-type esterase/lipase family protein [Bacteroidota bacterium]